MRGYFIDELSEGDLELFRGHFNAKNMGSSVEDLFWIPIPEDLLTPLQKEHKAECAPHLLGVELSASSLRLEFLVRASGRMRCECLSFASEALQRYVIDYIEAILPKLGAGALCYKEDGTLQ